MKQFLYTLPVIIAEYRDVLGRAKFNFPQDDVVSFLQAIIDNGLYVNPSGTDVPFSDPSDKPFYEAAVAAGCWLVTGNKRHLSQRTLHREPTGVH